MITNLDEEAKEDFITAFTDGLRRELLVIAVLGQLLDFLDAHVGRLSVLERSSQETVDHDIWVTTNGRREMCVAGKSTCNQIAEGHSLWTGQGVVRIIRLVLHSSNTEVLGQLHGLHHQHAQDLVD